MCIYKQAYEVKHKRHLFWDYIKHVHEECDTKLNEDCSIFAHKETGLDYQTTKKCVEDSFSVSDQNKWGFTTTTNSMIETDLDYWAKYGSSLFPSVVINNSTYRGQLETQAVMNAICAGFKDAPRQCKRLLETEDIEHNLGVGVIYFDDGYRMHHVLGVCMMFMFSLTIFLCCYRRYAKRQMKETMNV